MESRTREYLKGRFGDHYRRSDVTLPPAARRREWGYIPWQSGDGTTMIRHRSLADLGDIGSFLSRERPRHVYFSAGRYGDPAAGRMDDKEWRGADLVFDLDADHLPGVDPSEADYGEMLAACKRELESLLSFLEDDFGFADLTIAFSGGRGYHVHVRDHDVLPLGRGARREIVDYISGHGIDPEAVILTEPIAGAGRHTATAQRRLDPSAGWSRRVHRTVLAYVDELAAADPAAALERLQRIEGIGERRASAILEAIERADEEIRAGNIDVHPAFVRLVASLTERAVATERAAIDEPVTTDVNRLIRLPGSLHGGSGLAVRPLERDELAAFDPLTDAIPGTFRGQEIAIEASEPASVRLDGERHEVPVGLSRVPEFVGIHLLATGRAEKARETAI